MRAIAVILALGGSIPWVPACGGGGAAADAALPADANPHGPDADPNAPDADSTIPDAEPSSPDSAVPPELPRGLAWVRANPMFISGLTVSMPAPNVTAVGEYFDLFHANAVHLWQDGLPTQMDGWAAAGHSGFRFVSWVRNDGTSQDGGEVIGGYAADTPGRIGYQIGDEPSNLSELAETNLGIDAVRAADPDALVIVNFSFSADGLTEMLEQYGSNLNGDVVSFDTYSFSNNVYDRLRIFRDAGLAHQKPYWCYLRSYADAGSGEWSSESDMRWNAFSHLTFGYTGYSWFVYQLAPPHTDQLAPALFETPADFAATKTERYAIAAQINLELANLGRAITQLTSTDVRYIPAIDVLLPAGMTSWSAGAGGNPYITSIAPVGGGFQDILVGFFDDDDGEQYVMVQNVNHTSGSWPVDSSNQATIHLDFDFASVGDANFDKTEVLVLSKETGAVGSAPLTSTGPGTAALEITLAAGDAALFKYETGKPFALQ